MCEEREREREKDDRCRSGQRAPEKRNDQTCPTAWRHTLSAAELTTADGLIESRVTLKQIQLPMQLLRFNLTENVTCQNMSSFHQKPVCSCHSSEQVSLLPGDVVSSSLRTVSP